MSKELADALRATLPVLQHATLFGTPAQQADAVTLPPLHWWPGTPGTAQGALK